MPTMMKLELESGVPAWVSVLGWSPNDDIGGVTINCHLAGKNLTVHMDEKTPEQFFDDYRSHPGKDVIALVRDTQLTVEEDDEPVSEISYQVITSWMCVGSDGHGNPVTRVFFDLASQNNLSSDCHGMTPEAFEKLYDKAQNNGQLIDFTRSRKFFCEKPNPFYDIAALLPS